VDLCQSLADRYHHDVMGTIETLALGTIAGRRVDVREGYFKYPVGAGIFFCSANRK
jgi:toxin ParE1/3/4